MKTLFCFILATLTCHGAAVFKNATISNYRVVTASSSCPSSPSLAAPTWSANTYPVCDLSTRRYVGVLWPNTQPERVICRVNVLLSTGAGTVTSKHLRVGIWTVNAGTAEMVSEVGYSSTVTGISPGEMTSTRFDFSPAITMDANTFYAVVLYTTEDVDPINYFAIGWTDSDTVTGAMQVWTSALAPEGPYFSAWESCFDLYWQ